MSSDDRPRPRKRVRKRRRRKRPRSDGEDDSSSNERGEEVLEIGTGEFAVMTVNRETGQTVVQRFESQQEARAQYRRNVEHDKPLAQTDEEVN